MKILITGGFGYLGGRLAKELSESANYEICLSSRERENAPEWFPTATIINSQLDVTSYLRDITSGCDVIIHMAGMNALECASYPIKALEVNGVGTARLLDAAIQESVKRFIYISTAHVYGNPLTGTISEICCPNPVHPYATSHRTGEDVVLSAHQRGDIEGVVIRLSNTFGEPMDKNVDCWMLLVNDLCHQVVKNGYMKLRSSGLQRRDFITMNDACRAIHHLMIHPVENLDNGLFNIGGRWSPTVLGITNFIAERFYGLTGKKAVIIRNIEDQNNITMPLDYQITKLLNTGFKLNRSISHEIDSLLLFCEDNLSWCH